MLFMGALPKIVAHERMKCFETNPMVAPHHDLIVPFVCCRNSFAKCFRVL